MEASCFTFRPGSDVEVRSIEKGSKDAWYPATIMDQPAGPTLRKRNPSKKNILVQFKTMYDPKDPEKLLVEHTTLSLLRPDPPADNAARFEQNDVVDALDNGMWWPGVVMEVAGDMYTVGFKEPPDLLVLPRDKLRSHWDWANGVWTRAPREVTVSDFITPGAEVEINLYKDELWCSWLPAVILGQLRSNSFLVQYRYKTPDNHSENALVKEVVLEHQIRPRPPLQEDKGFALMDMVDAYHDMGWWVGHVMQIPMKDKYIVRFRITGEEKEFSFSELRCHLDWIRKKWVKFPECQSYRRKSKDSRDSSLNSVEQTSSNTKFWGKQLSPCMEIFPYGEPTTKLKMPPQPNGCATFLSPTPSKKLKGVSSKGTSSHAQFRERKSPVKTSNGEGVVTNDEGIKHDNKDQMISGQKRKEKQAKLLVQQSNDPKAGCSKDPVELSASPRLNTTLVTHQKRRRFELTGVKRNGTADVTKVQLPNTKCVEGNPAGTLNQQTPQPLLTMKEVLQGSAIGCMKAFASLIEKISKLQVSDSKDLIDKHLEALRELELLGYDVKPTRHRLNDLLGMKVKLGQLENRSKEVEIRIAGGTQDKNNCDERISGIDKGIEEMQQKRMAVVSTKEIKVSEISRWQSEANDININIQSIQCDLGKLHDGLW